MIVPSQRAIDDVKARGVDLLAELTRLCYFAIDGKLNGKDVEYISISLNDADKDKMAYVGIDLAEQTARTYMEECQHLIDREMLKNAKEVIDLGDDYENGITDFFDNACGKVVMGPSIAAILQDKSDFIVAPMSPCCFPNKIYNVGRYKSVDVWVDPYMIWSDHKIYFI